MALKKVQKSIVFGSVLVAHYGKDLTDLTTSSATYVQWGTDIVITMQFATSHLEIVTTGSGMVDTNQGSGSFYGNAKYMINGQDEYFLRGIVGGNMSLSGAHSHQNQQHGESNGRQNFRWYGYSTSLYMNHIHRPNSTNEQTQQSWAMVDSGSFTVTLSSGFTTVTEIAGEGYNLT
jgi:hypothetical protein